MKNARTRKGEALLECFPAFVGPMPSLAALLQWPMPHPSYATLELSQRLIVGRHAVVAVMPVEHLAQPDMLFCYPMVPAAPGFLLETG